MPLINEEPRAQCVKLVDGKNKNVLEELNKSPKKLCVPNQKSITLKCTTKKKKKACIALIQFTLTFIKKNKP